jgi:hypothetical protein
MKRRTKLVVLSFLVLWGLLLTPDRILYASKSKKL